MKNTSFDLKPLKTRGIKRPGNTCSRRKIRNTIVAGLITASLMTIAGNMSGGQEMAKMGEVAYNPEIYDVSELQNILDPLFSNYFGISMKHDLLIKLDTENVKISFQIDGYHSNMMIGYEWINPAEKPESGDSAQYLSEKELAVYTNQKYAGNHLLLINTKNKYQIKQDFLKFYSAYTNDHPKKKK